MNSETAIFELKKSHGFKRAKNGNYHSTGRSERRGRIAHHFSQPRVIWGTLHLPFISRELWHNRLANPTAGVTHLVACVDGIPVGQCHLQIFDTRPRRKHAGEIGMAVHDDWQGKEIGSALMTAILDMADNWFNLLRVELDLFTDNEPAIRLYKKFRFIVEGTAKNTLFGMGSMWISSIWRA